MMSLIEKYRPRSINDFIGLEKPKRALTRFAGNPHPTAWFFSGPPGIGKTAMARALAADLSAEIHLLSSNQCTRGALDRLWASCQYQPPPGLSWHLILVDNADLLTAAQQALLRSFLDQPSTNVIWVLAGLSSDHLQEGLRSRCHQLRFSSHGIAPAAADRLAQIWSAEASSQALPPNFARLVKDSKNNIRAAILALESLLDLRG